MGDADLVRVIILVFAWWLIMSRLDRLGKQMGTICTILQLEMAELLGNQHRANELREERRQDQAHKTRRQFWIGLGVMGAAAIVLVWWWFIAQR
jgi:hypothetical protein